MYVFVYRIYLFNFGGGSLGPGGEPWNSRVVYPRPPRGTSRTPMGLKEPRSQGLKADGPQGSLAVLRFGPVQSSLAQRLGRWIKIERGLWVP